MAVWDAVSEAKRLAEGDAETLGRLLNASALTSAFVDMPARWEWYSAGPVGRLRPQSRSWLLGAPARRDDAACMQLTPAQLAHLPPDRRAKTRPAPASRKGLCRGTTPADAATQTR